MWSGVSDLKWSNKSMWADILLVVFLGRTIALYFFISLFRSWHGPASQAPSFISYIYLPHGSNVLFPRTDFTVSPTIPLLLISLLRFCLVSEALGILSRLPAILTPQTTGRFRNSPSITYNMDKISSTFLPPLNSPFWQISRSGRDST